MADVFTKKKRSQVMSLIRSHGNKNTELRMIRIFRENHITGWRRRQKVFGNPDFVFYKQRIALFVDGCFWHGCPKCNLKPSTNEEFWIAKICKNRSRDKHVNIVLKKKNWNVVRFWEHNLKNANKVLARLEEIFSRKLISSKHLV